ncbi:hypothetical protein IE81DRAFT_79404 [Ceraceosorus guamensis]|uniref:Uncharacterized protein n=1 Tax=Ceraceosorus guamensis TaxID=1522189 RepID=A0A316W7Z3_9BASI|nr:hypothetical protein IE81DRAFT_79404 [Ceraceosorus guamensis]PWN45989.1 hypothetical protein IE81DRAFT_79404 [Ceraceosorus guamensis]
MRLLSVVAVRTGLASAHRTHVFHSGASPLLTAGRCTPLRLGSFGRRAIRDAALRAAAVCDRSALEKKLLLQFQISEPGFARFLHSQSAVREQPSFCSDGYI